jgi:hypothetical protein
MPDRPASSQSGTGLKKLTMPEQVRYRTELTQSGIFLVWYRTKIRDAGMPMPALVFWMPMPSYGSNQCLLYVNKGLMWKLMSFSMFSPFCIQSFYVGSFSTLCHLTFSHSTISHMTFSHSMLSHSMFGHSTFSLSMFSRWTNCLYGSRLFGLHMS